MKIRKFSEFNVVRLLNKIDKFIGIKDGIKVSKLIKNNAKIALEDIKSGKIFDDDESAQNLSNVINDVLKGSILGAIYIIPGTTIPFIVLRNLLKTSKNEKIRRILEFTVSEKETKK